MRFGLSQQILRVLFSRLSQVGLCVTILLSFQAHASGPTSCQTPGSTVFELKPIQPILASLQEATSKSCTPSELMRLAREKLRADQFQVFERAYRSFFFFDPKLLFFENALEAHQELKEPLAFNKQGEVPLDGALAAREVLKSHLFKEGQNLGIGIKNAHRALLSKESIQPSHQEALKREGISPRNSENAMDSELGQFRKVCSYFLSKSSDCTQEESISLWLENSTSPPESPCKRLEESVQNNPFLSIQKQSESENRVNYPCLKDSKDIPNILERFGDQLGQELKPSDSPETLQSVLTNGLLTAAFQRFKATLKEFKEDREKIIEATARLQYDFISIHPFTNGNGRLGRLIAEVILEHYGIHPPLFPFWGEDILLPQDKFVQVFKKGVDLSQQLSQEACSQFSRGEAGTFSAAQALDFFNWAPVFSTEPSKKMSLPEYAQWVKRNQLSLKLDSSSQLSESKIRTLVSPFISDFLRHKNEKPMRIADFLSLKPASLEDFSQSGSNMEAFQEMERARERRLLQVLARPGVRQFFTWQGKKAAEHLLQNGVKSEAVKQRLIPSRDSKNLAGDGLYVDPTFYASVEFAQAGGRLLVVNLRSKDRLLDAYDPGTLRSLYQLGYTGDDLLHLSTATGVYYNRPSTNEGNSNWMILKKEIPKEQIREATGEDLDLRLFSLLYHHFREDPLEHQAELPIFEQILQKEDEKFLSRWMRDSTALETYSPSGKCWKRVQGEKFQLQSSGCQSISLDCVCVDEECYQISPEKFILGRMKKEPAPNCQSDSQFFTYAEAERRIFDARKKGSPLKAVLSDSEAQAISNDNLFVFSKPGGVTYAKKISMNPNGVVYLENFNQVDQAKKALLKSGPVFNFNRFADRFKRNIEYFAKSLEKSLRELQNSKGGLYGEIQFTRNPIQNRALIQKMRQSIFDEIQLNNPTTMKFPDNDLHSFSRYRGLENRIVIQAPQDAQLRSEILHRIQEQSGVLRWYEKKDGRKKYFTESDHENLFYQDGVPIRVFFSDPKSER
ncbi:MAG: Fic family protein [Bdellovibrionia bacterium]